MELYSFLREILVDSLAGVSFQNLPFIIIQLLSSALVTLLIINILKLQNDNRQILAWSVLFTLVFMVAITSVPLSILATAVALGFIFKNTKVNTETRFLILMVAYVSAAGHLVLLLISLLIVFLYSKLVKSNVK